MKKHIKTKYIDEEVEIIFQKYIDGKTTHISMRNPATGESIATATIMTPDIPDGHVAIKDCFENEGVLEALIGAEIIAQPVYVTQCGFSVVHICALITDESEEPILKGTI